MRSLLALLPVLCPIGSHALAWAAQEQPPKVIAAPEPCYTQGVEGTVQMQVEINSKGLSSRFRLLTHLGQGADQTAIECAQRWRFRPATRDGIPVPGTLPIDIKLVRGIHGHLLAAGDFPGLPANIATDLTKRGCNIPQLEGLPGPHNVIQGHFMNAGSRDWAVLCLTTSRVPDPKVQKNTSVILVYRNGSERNPAMLGRREDFIGPFPLNDGYYRILNVVSEKFIRGHAGNASSSTDPIPAVIDHDGIEDGIIGKASIVHYFLDGKWLTLPGTD